MQRNRIFIGATVAATTVMSAILPTHAVTPEQAFKAGCGGCHASETNILRRIPTGTEAVRRAWILNFMAGHPNERDAVKAEIVEYLVQRAPLRKAGDRGRQLRRPQTL